MRPLEPVFKQRRRLGRRSWATSASSTEAEAAAVLAQRERAVAIRSLPRRRARHRERSGGAGPGGPASRRRRRARCSRASGLEAAAASRRVGARVGRRGGRRACGASRGAGAAHVRAAARGPSAFARGSRRSAADGHHPPGCGSRLRRAAGGAAAEAGCAGSRGTMDRALSAALRRRRADRAASAAAVLYRSASRRYAIDRPSRQRRAACERACEVAAQRRVATQLRVTRQLAEASELELFGDGVRERPGDLPSCRAVMCRGDWSVVRVEPVWPTEYCVHADTRFWGCGSCDGGSGGSLDA